MKPGFFKTNRRANPGWGVTLRPDAGRFARKLHPSLVLVVSPVLGLAWHIYDAEATPTDQQGQRPHGMPKWSFTTAVAHPDGLFEILH